MLNVELKNGSLKVGIKGQAAPLVDGEFHKRIHLDDTLWQMVDGDLVLFLAKENKMEVCSPSAQRMCGVCVCLVFCALCLCIMSHVLNVLCPAF